MERLTFEGNFCDIAQCRELPCKYDGTARRRRYGKGSKHMKILDYPRRRAQRLGKLRKHFPAVVIPSHEWWS